MTDMLVYWIKEFDLDGYRCDAAGEVPTDFWEQARVELEKVKPDIMMLAEASKPELLRTAFDIDYSWPLLRTLNDIVMNGEPATALRTIDRAAAGIVPERRTAHARERRPRRAARDDALWIPGRDRRIGADVYARWRATDLQRHGGGRLHAIARPRSVRAAEDILAGSRRGIRNIRNSTLRSLPCAGSIRPCSRASYVVAQLG